MSDKDCLQLLILEKIRQDIYSVLKERYGEQNSLTDKHLLALIFKNYRFRNGHHHGLRLTYLGNRVLAKHYESYSYMHGEKPTHKDLLVLDKQMIWPYYISKNTATFYSENDAAWFTINGANLSKFTEYI